MRKAARASSGSRTPASCCRPAASDFLGNVEGRDLPLHPADVVVCDASVGNVVMKFFEGSSGHVRHAPGRVQKAAVGAHRLPFMRPGINRIRRKLRLRTSRRAPLLGVNGTVLITHGRATATMIGFALDVGAAAARQRIPDRIADALG